MAPLLMDLAGQCNRDLADARSRQALRPLQEPQTTLYNERMHGYNYFALHLAECAPNSESKASTAAH